jgi:hypothetical protein
MRVVGFIVLAALIGVATSFLLDRILIGVFVTAGIFLVALLVLISRAESPGPEP